jgi:HEPN domain-containing protein
MSRRLDLAKLYDRRRPLGAIARRLHPYLRVLLRDFAPQQVIVFGSYAYGVPHEGSDVDLLIITPIQKDVLADALAIRKAFRPLAPVGRAMAFDLLLESPQRHGERIANGGAFYAEINDKGVSLITENDMHTDETNPSDWYLLGSDKLRAADAVYEALGPSLSCVELLHEAVERYLKGWLVGRGWKLVRTHDLQQLVDAAGAIEPKYLSYSDFAADLTQQFFLQHYPGGDLGPVGQNYDELRATAGRIIDELCPPDGAA